MADTRERTPLDRIAAVIAQFTDEQWAEASEEAFGTVPIMREQAVSVLLAPGAETFDPRAHLPGEVERLRSLAPGADWDAWEKLNADHRRVLAELEQAEAEIERLAPGEQCPRCGGTNGLHMEPGCPGRMESLAPGEARQEPVAWLYEGPGGHRELAWSYYDSAYSKVVPLYRGAAPQQWQPIESAPKDGTRVLLFSPYGEKGRVHTGSAQGPGGNWWEAGHSVHPTHFMPLPAAPQVQEKEPVSAQSEVRVSDEAKRAEVEEALQIENLVRDFEEAVVQSYRGLHHQSPTERYRQLRTNLIAALRSAVGAPRGQTEPTLLEAFEAGWEMCDFGEPGKANAAIAFREWRARVVSENEAEPASPQQQRDTEPV